MSSQAQLAARFDDIQRRIELACKRVGRDPAEVAIVGASKSQPVERLAWAWEVGLEIFGENRVQEALAKQAELPTEIDWHLIGPLQSNKARKAAEIFSTIHSIDRLKIARALDREADRLGRSLRCFVEVNLAAEETKHGFAPEDLAARLEPLTELGALDIIGLMAIPPFESDPDKARAWFRQLRELRDRLAATGPLRASPGYLSMGMSQDFELAIEEGATHVRIGTSLFGPRGG